MSKPNLFKQRTTSITGQNVPLNKGHFSMDTEERINDFGNKLASGWEAEYEEYRRLWIELPRLKKIRDYPLLVDLELVSVCNLKCPMCPTITEAFQSRARKGKGLMDFELVKKILDEIAGKVFALRLSFVGESTLHKKLIDCVSYAREKGIREISFLTNGSKLELPYFERLVEAGIDWITISIDGTGETYNKIRKPITFDQILKVLQDIHDYKMAKGLKKPVIKIQGVWPAIRENPSEYYSTLAPLVDLVAYNPLIDYLRHDSNDEVVYEDNFSCPQYYQRIVIGSDGNAIMCSNDDEGDIIIGNAYEQTIHEIWHSEKLNELRNIHSEECGFLNIKPCKQCYYPRKTVVDETAMVNDRLIYIENYVNRNQTIGE